MSTLKAKLATSGLLGLVTILVTSGVAEAKLAGNHNDIVLMDGAR